MLNHKVRCFDLLYAVIIIPIHAVIPSSYITIDADTVSVSGSSATGHCSSVNRSVSRLTCTDPTSSVLFDGVIPTLTGLDGDMWASQLLTLQTTAGTRTRAIVLFDFTDTAGYVGLSGRLEVVMFNCLEKGISASTIRVSTSSSPSVNPTPLMVVNIGITSCDSLVRVCTQIPTTQPSITLEFVIGATSDMVYLAEVTFYAASSASTCPPDTIITTAPPDTIITTAPPDTIITTAPPDTIAPPTTALEVPQTVSLTTPVPDSTTPEDSTTPTGTSATITSVIVPVVVVICVVFMIVGIMAAVLILWRCHKHKTSHHTALGEGHSHAHTHSHPPPVKMCEETGQVCYSSPPEALWQLSPSHDTYSHIQRDTSEGRGRAPSHQGGSNEVSHGNSPHVLGGGGEDSASQLYAQVDKKPMKRKKKKSTLATYLDEERSAVNTLELEASKHLYDRVDAKKKDNDIPTHSHTSEAGTTDQLYAQVDKKNKKRKKGEVASHSHTSEAGTTDQLYAQVDKKVNKKKGEEATHSHTPEADAPMDQLYAQVDKKKRQKKCEVTVHPDADTAVNQLYAQVDKKKKKVCKDSNSA